MSSPAATTIRLAEQLFEAFQTGRAIPPPRETVAPDSHESVSKSTPWSGESTPSWRWIASEVRPILRPTGSRPALRCSSTSARCTS